MIRRAIAPLCAAVLSSAPLELSVAPAWAASAAAMVPADAAHSPKQPRAGEPVHITLRCDAAVKAVTLQFQTVDPGKYIALGDPEFAIRWESKAMTPIVAGEPGTTNRSTFATDLPGSLQLHRRLVRYRFRLIGPDSKAVTLPATDVPEPNYAYFVYDGIPAWSGAIEPRSSDPKRKAVVTFGPEVMRSVQAYHLISKQTWVENATWREHAQDKEYKYTGTFVGDGEVYDHVRFRARGGVWRYAMGKNMWKVAFNAGHDLQARDNYGRAYREKWSKLDLRACIQQGDYGQRGEQGMFEAVGFELFNLAGVEAPRTHWVQLRIVTGPTETPPDQYQGDFWGLYLAIENEDGRFLKEHKLPDGNLYKMMQGQGLLSHQGKSASTNGTDLERFMRSFEGRRASETWWQTNVDLLRYYSYRSIVEAIHHYDIADGKNYDFYLNPVTRKWSVIPWDIDLTWADHMYGTGQDPFLGPVLSRPVFRLEYQNRLREIRDLLFNPGAMDPLIDEFAAVIAHPDGSLSMVDADRAKWDYHPALASRYSMRGKADQGRFYQASPTGNFKGMVSLMKEYVRTRGAWIDDALLNDPSLPPTPKLNSTGPPGFPANRLQFKCSAFQGNSAFAGLEWRLGASARFERSPAQARPGLYEIATVWDSGVLTSFRDQADIPPELIHPGQKYRARVRMKDSSGRWSHWSAPVEFVAGPPQS